MTLIDSHCHLDAAEFDADRAAAGVVGDEEAQRVQRVVHLAVIRQAEFPVQLG